MPPIDVELIVDKSELDRPLREEDSNEVDRTYFHPPKVVGQYSIDKEKRFHNDRSEVKHLCEELIGQDNLNWNLHKGFRYEQFMRMYIALTVSIRNHFQTWIVSEADKSKRDNLKEVCCNADIITYRTLLSIIAVTPYKSYKGWKFVATRLKNQNVIILGLGNVGQNRTSYWTKNKEIEQNKRQYSGLMFEKGMTVDRPEARHNRPDSLGPISKYHNVISSCIERNERSFRLLYSAEIDAIDQESNPVELKTCVAPLENAPIALSVSWLLQCFLVGINSVVVGLKPAYGKPVSSVKKLTMDGLENLQRGLKEKELNPPKCVCLNFLQDVLEKMDTFLSESSLDSCTIEFIPNKKRVFIRKCIKGEGEEIHYGAEFKDRFGI